MTRFSKQADSSPEAAASPLPALQITTTPAPGKRGPAGLSPRQNYSRVNSGAPPPPDAGSSAQKSVPPLGAAMLPQKVAHVGEESMATMAPRPTIQDMVKAAMAGASRASIADEAARQQQAQAPEEKIASTSDAANGAGESVSTDYALKLASAIEYLLPQVKEATQGGVGTGPGALTVLEAKADGHFPINPGGQGHGHHTPPKTPAMQAARPHDPGNQMENNANHPAGGSGVMVQKNAAATPPLGGIRAAWTKLAAPAAAAPPPPAAEKTATPDNLVDMLLHTVKQAGQTKKAEDAINPAHIAAGAAVPPAASASGERGGAPASPTGSAMVGSNEAARNYTKGQAKAGPKSDVGKYLTEPALSGATDKTLAEAFSHTGQAGTKFASAVENPDIAAAAAVATEGAIKVAAGRALLAKLAASADDEKKKKEKEKESHGGMGSFAAPQVGGAGAGPMM